MNSVAETDWSFENILAVDAARAQRLESCGAPEELIASLEDALSRAIGEDNLRIAVDSIDNKFMKLRAILQFPVTPELYDWFFNARTGYRAQFWISPETGMAFNEKIVKRLTRTLARRLPEALQVRKIAVEFLDGSREETDLGAMKITRDQLLASLVPEASKIWIGERFYTGELGDVPDFSFGILRYAEKLDVPRWIEAGGEEAEGLRAPCPVPEYSWLDVKGGFLNEQGKADQIKPQDKRARQIHERGWT